MPENIRINDANFSLGPQEGFFYSISFSLDSLLQIEEDGTVVGSFPITRSQIRNPILELHYDGTFFWTLEKLPSGLGSVIKKWRLFPFKTVLSPNATPTELRWQDEITLLSQTNIIYEGEAFAVEHYHRSISQAVTKGANTIRLNSVDKINPGIILYLGPSSSSSNLNNEEQIVVQGVNPNTNDITFIKAGGLENDYISGDAVDFHTGVWVFNDHDFTGITNNKGALIRFSYPQKSISLISTGAKYSDVNAADFDQNRLSFVRAFMIMTLNIDSSTFDLESSLEANLMESNKWELIKVFDLISDLDNNQYFKLQQKETTENLGTGTLTTINFEPLFNFQTETTLPFVNSIALRFDPTRFAITGNSPQQRGFTVTAEVRDQFNFPVLGRGIQFTASQNDLGDPGTPGTMNPSIGFTSISGTVSSTYIPSNTPNDFLLDITAEVL